MAYSVEYVPAAVVEELRGSHNLGVFINLQTEPALHIWLGMHDIPALIDAVDPDGTLYLGAGRLREVPTLEILVNGTSDAVEFTVSGIDPATGAKMYDSIPAIRGADMYVGITTLDQYYQPMTGILPLWKGVASHLNRSSLPAQSDQNRTVSLGLVASSGEPGRSRSTRALWSDAHQKAISPTDDFCKGTSRLARGNQPLWPNYG